ncbi:MAG: VacJ family lipoprotein [Proteobacteria bacterium]|nr:VacJ family lipoprotein [Pseudomonadota bacterium]MBU4470922.1 VacJ family lipoprotein [Pseudomonadota bacterium]MCG2751920.1 VacJ family lipoprotein [Desulfobacteraceae bacterium]
MPKRPGIPSFILSFSLFFLILCPWVIASGYGAETADVAQEDGDFEFMEEEFGHAPISVADPLKPFNRAMFQFNDKLYFWALKPAARGYSAVVPLFARKGIKNFFYNIRAPIRIAGSLLQFKGEKAMAEYSRFLINTTMGVLGFRNAVKNYPHLNPGEEDSGQTLAHYGIGNGFYLVLPFLGPSSLRDAVGLFGDSAYLDPTAYIKPTEAYYGARALDTVNGTSLRLGDYETLKKSALDPYEAFRNAYIQYRNNQIQH